MLELQGEERHGKAARAENTGRSQKSLACLGHVQTAITLDGKLAPAQWMHVFLESEFLPVPEGKPKATSSALQSHGLWQMFFNKTQVYVVKDVQETSWMARRGCWVAGGEEASKDHSMPGRTL